MFQGAIADNFFTPVFEDPEPSADERIEELERENDMLRSKIAALERKLMARSPTKKPKPKPHLFQEHESTLEGSLISGESDVENVYQKFSQLKLADSYQSSSIAPKTPGKKIRKLTARRRDLGPEEEL